MKNSYIKITVLTFTLLILNSSFLTRNCVSQWSHVNNTGYGYLVSSGNNIYGTNSYGQIIHRSTNTGANWSQIYYAGNYIFSLAASGSNVYVGTYDGVFMSTNNGTNWTQTSLNHP